MLAAARAQAALYKWTDANGRVVYRRPAAAGKRQGGKRQSPASPPADPERGARAWPTKDAEIKKRQQDRADDRSQGRQGAAPTRRSSGDMCAQARGRIRTLREDVNVYRYNEKGEKVFFEPAERESDRRQREDDARSELRASAGGADELTQRWPVRRSTPARRQRRRRRASAAGASPERYFFSSVRLVDLDVGLRLEAREVGRRTARDRAARRRARRTPTASPRPARGAAITWTIL